MTTPILRLRQEMMARDDGRDPLGQGADYRRLREYNQLLVLNNVRRQGAVARFAIAQQTGLSKTTVSNVIDQLLQDGLVSEGDFMDASAGGGRRPILVQFNADIGIVLGIEIGFSVMTMVTTNLAGEVKSILNEPFDLTAAPAICLARIAATIKIFSARTGLQWDQVVGIGIGIATSINVRTHTILFPPGEHTWEGIDLAAHLMQQFQVPIFLDNNANLAALCEGRYGVGKAFNDFVYITIGQGIGGGLIQNQQIYRGALGAAGEIGHMQLVDDGPPCFCGKHGCLETLADNDAIVDDVCQGRSLARVAPRARVSPQFAIPEEIEITDILHAAESGDMSARLALQQAGRYIGAAVANVISVLNPEAVIIDGPTVRTGRYLFEALQDESARRTFPSIWSATKIIRGKLGDLAVAWGAATLVIDAAFTSPAPLATDPSA